MRERKCRLFRYDLNTGKKIGKEKEFGSIYCAVKAGYEGDDDFNVVELLGEDAKLYWTGSPRDFKRPDFRQWEGLALEKDMKFGCQQPKGGEQDERTNLYRR